MMFNEMIESAKKASAYAWHDGGGYKEQDEAFARSVLESAAKLMCWECRDGRRRDVTKNPNAPHQEWCWHRDELGTCHSCMAEPIWRVLEATNEQPNREVG